MSGNKRNKGKKGNKGNTKTGSTRKGGKTKQNSKKDRRTIIKEVSSLIVRDLDRQHELSEYTKQYEQNLSLVTKIMNLNIEDLAVILDTAKREPKKVTGIKLVFARLMSKSINEVDLSSFSKLKEIDKEHYEIAKELLFIIEFQKYIKEWEISIAKNGFSIELMVEAYNRIPERFSNYPKFINRVLRHFDSIFDKSVKVENLRVENEKLKYVKQNTLTYDKLNRVLNVVSTTMQSQLGDNLDLFYEFRQELTARLGKELEEFMPTNDPLLEVDIKETLRLKLEKMKKENLIKFKDYKDVKSEKSEK